MMAQGFSHLAPAPAAQDGCHIRTEAPKFKRRGNYMSYRLLPFVQVQTVCERQRQTSGHVCCVSLELSSRSVFRKPVPIPAGEGRRCLTSSILIPLSAQMASFHQRQLLLSAFFMWNKIRPACRNLLLHLFQCCWRWR